MIDYEGIFFDDDEVKKMQMYESHPHNNIHEKVHCTFVYKPNEDEIYDEIVNKEIYIYLVSYGYDDNNSGFEVEIPKKFMKYYKNYDFDGNFVMPHITSSISDNGLSKNTHNLNFAKMKEKVKITGRFGYWIKKDNDEYLSFEPYKK